MEETKRCPKCGGEMKRGYLIFQFGATQGNVSWSEKKGGLSRRLTIKQPPAMCAYSCQKCGYVECYIEG